MRPHYRIENTTRGTILAQESENAVTHIRRGIGLMGRRGLPEGGGLIIQPCNSIVCFFMRFPIDVLFIDANDHVCHLYRGMRPWRTSRIVRASKFVIELPAGSLERTDTVLNDEVRIAPAAGQK